MSTYDDEPDISINGTRLSEGQALSVRVAVEMFLIELSDPGFHEGLGPVANGYQARLLEARALMFKSVRPEACEFCLIGTKPCDCPQAVLATKPDLGLDGSVTKPLVPALPRPEPGVDLMARKAKKPGGGT